MGEAETARACGTEYWRVGAIQGESSGDLQRSPRQSLNNITEICNTCIIGGPEGLEIAEGADCNYLKANCDDII